MRETINTITHKVLNKIPLIGLTSLNINKRTGANFILYQTIKNL